jgi:hypothetical protein
MRQTGMVLAVSTWSDGWWPYVAVVVLVLIVMVACNLWRSVAIVVNLYTYVRDRCWKRITPEDEELSQHHGGSRDHSGDY